MRRRPHHLRVGNLRLAVDAGRCPAFVVVAAGADDLRRLLDGRKDVVLMELHVADNGGPGQLWALCAWREDRA